MRMYVVHAFAEKVFEGNPTAVCVMEKWISDSFMQKITSENNLSETAFTVKNGSYYELRWFTPGGEIDLCGHATLATAYVLANFYATEDTSFVFETKSGELRVERRREIFELNFPSRMPSQIGLTEQMINALGVEPLSVYLDRDLMFVLENEEAVKGLSPNFFKLKALLDGLGVIVTAATEHNAYHFVSRAFFPKIAVNEDPVCGSAHTQLIPYWAKELGKEIMVARQLSARGGTLHCRFEGERVMMGGTAVLYATSDIQVNS